MSNFDWNYRAFMSEVEAVSCNPCRPAPRPVCPPRPCPCPPMPMPTPPGPGCCVCPRGRDGKSAYQIALENGFVGTEAQWLASLRGEPGPFLSSYMEAVGSAQTVAANASIVFDPDSIDRVGNNITLNATGTVFTITRPGLYHVEWSLNLAEGPTAALPAIVGVLENGQPASGAASSTAGNFGSGSLIHVTTVPFSLSLQNYERAIALASPDNRGNIAASIRIVRIADGASV